MFQIIPSIMSLPLTLQDNVEATQEFSLPEKDLPPSRTYHFLPRSHNAAETKNAHPAWGVTSFPFLSSLVLTKKWLWSLLPPPSASFTTLQSVLPVETLTSALRDANYECPAYPALGRYVGYQMLREVIWLTRTLWYRLCSSHCKNKNWDFP